MTLSNQSWRTGHRYSEFYQFYSETYSESGKSFPNGMNNAFPTDRLSNWLSLKNQETINDTRRQALDSWLKELCNSPKLMLHDATMKKVFQFLRVDENLKVINKNPQKLPHDGQKKSAVSPCPPQPPPREPLKIGQKSPAKVEEKEDSFTHRRKAAVIAASNNDSSRPADSGSSIHLPSEVILYFYF